jgi:hypothetical protein
MKKRYFPGAFRNIFLIHIWILAFVTFIVILTTASLQQPMPIQLYSSGDTITKTSFRMFFESTHPVIESTYRLNLGSSEPFSSGDLFDEEGQYDFVVINQAGVRQTEKIILDQSGPIIKDFSSSSSYRVGQTIIFTDTFSSIKEVIISIDDEPPYTITTNQYRLSRVGQYRVQIFDQLDQQSVYNFDVYDSNLIDVGVVIGIGIPVIVSISLLALIVYFVILKRRV